jgi:hypothetical protein
MLAQRLSGYSTFGKSGHTKSHRSCIRASRFGQSVFSISRHFIMLPFGAVFFDQFEDVIAALAVAFGAFDAEYIELAVEIAESEIAARH